MSMLKIKNFSKVYKGGKRAVDKLNLTVEAGDIYGFIGHNVPRYEQETGSLFRHLQLWRELYT